MALAVRFKPNANVAALRPANGSGRTYMVGGAATVDVPAVDAENMDQAQRLMFVGQTSDRPQYDVSRTGGPMPPLEFYDLSLNRVVFYILGTNPAQYCDITGECRVMAATKVTAGTTFPKYIVQDAHNNQITISHNVMTPGVVNLQIGTVVLSQKNVIDLLPAFQSFAATGQLS